jgi:hypothetical protein
MTILLCYSTRETAELLERQRRLLYWRSQNSPFLPSGQKLLDARGYIFDLDALEHSEDSDTNNGLKHRYSVDAWTSGNSRLNFRLPLSFQTDFCTVGNWTRFLKCVIMLYDLDEYTN